jgi:hypothetical protein
MLADESKRRTGEETIASDLTYDLRSGDPDLVRPIKSFDARPRPRAHIAEGIHQLDDVVNCRDA